MEIRLLDVRLNKELDEAIEYTTRDHPASAISSCSKRSRPLKELRSSKGWHLYTENTRGVRRIDFLTA